jgi:hypothetical protein
VELLWLYSPTTGFRGQQHVDATKAEEEKGKENKNKKK